MATMLLTTAKINVSIILKGSGPVSINWGNTKSNTYTLPVGSECVCTHNYTSTTPRTITITGTTITYLKCIDNQLTTLNLSGNTALVTLDCSNNQLTTLNLSGLTKLTELRCNTNQLTTLNLTGNPALFTLSCTSNKLTSLSVNGLSKLTNLSCNNNNLTSLNLTGDTSLSCFYCYNNNLTSLNVSGFSKLTYLHCYGNKLTSLSVSGLGSLVDLRCHSNNLTSLILSGCSGLKQLYCSNNYLTGLNLSGFANLTYLSCYGNNISSLAISNCTLLASIYCSENKLANLSVSGLSKLTYLNCKNNQMTGTALNNLFTSLPTIPAGVCANLYIASNPGLTGTGRCNTTTALNKRWIVDFDEQTYQAKRKQDINNYLKNIVLSEDIIQKAIDEEKRNNRIEGEYLITYEAVSRKDAAIDLITTCGRYGVYPGMLLVVDSRLGTAKPKESTLPRGKVTIDVDISTAKITGGYDRVVSPDHDGTLAGPVNNAINDVLANFGSRPMQTIFVDTSKLSISTDEMTIEAGCSGSFAGITAAAKFKQESNKHSIYFMTDFSQIFYTVTARCPTDLSTLFADSVNVEDIKKEFGTNPIIFVDSVSYGRQLYLVENLKGTDKRMMASFEASASMFSVKSEFNKNKNNVDYISDCVCKGGSYETAAKTLFEQSAARNPDDTDYQYCVKQLNHKRTMANNYKRQYTVTNLETGKLQTDVNGVIVSYGALRLDGRPRDAVFWKSGDHKVKRMVPNSGTTINIFNCSGSHNVVVSGCYTKFDSQGKELPILYDIHSGRDVRGEVVVVGSVSATNLNTKTQSKDWGVKPTKDLRDGGPDKSPNWGRVYNKKWLAPSVQLGSSVYRVCLRIRNRDKTGHEFTWRYILPGNSIRAAWLRKGNKEEDVNWYFNNEEDDQENNGQALFG